MTAPNRYQCAVNNECDRTSLLGVVERAGLPFTAELKRDTRTAEQNALLWPLLKDVSKQVLWHGLTLSKDDWKLIFLDALERQLKSDLRLVPNLEGDGFVSLRGRSSQLTKDQFSQLIELIYAFGAREGVTFRTDQPAQPKAA